MKNLNSHESGGGNLEIGAAITSGTEGSVLFIGAGGVLAQDNTNFHWNDTDNKLSLGGTDTMTVNGSTVTTRLAAHSFDSATASAQEWHNHSDTAARGPVAYFARSRGSSGTPTVVSSGDSLGEFVAVGFDGTDYATSAKIAFEVDGTPGSNDMPGRIVFSTAADGTQTLVEKMRINSAAGSGILITGGTATTNVQVLDITQTWNNSGVTFTGIKFNVTNTASATGSMLFDYQIGGTSYFNFTKAGKLTFGDASTGVIPTLTGDHSSGFARAFFQPASGNNYMSVFITPSGTNTKALFQLNNASDLSNRGRLIGIVDGVNAGLLTDAIGTPGSFITTLTFGENTTLSGGTVNTLTDIYFKFNGTASVRMTSAGLHQDTDVAGLGITRRTIQVLVTDPGGSAITTGDAKAIVRIPSDLTGFNLVQVAAAVTTVSSSGNLTIQVRNVTDAQDMLSTAITIEANEKDSVDATTQPVINTTYDDVATADQIAIDVDAAGTGAKGLIVSMTFEKP